MSGNVVAGVSTHSRLKAAGPSCPPTTSVFLVSTHSRLKAAGFLNFWESRGHSCFNTQPPEGGWAFLMGFFAVLSLRFNTQPPEGGWVLHLLQTLQSGSFNTQPPEGGWVNLQSRFQLSMLVSTHSRLKAAGDWRTDIKKGFAVSTHSRLKAAGNCYPIQPNQYRSFNTQPPEGGWDGDPMFCLKDVAVSTHSRLKAAGWYFKTACFIYCLFQHTAA